MAAAAAAADTATAATAAATGSAANSVSELPITLALSDGRTVVVADGLKEEGGVETIHRSGEGRGRERGARAHMGDGRTDGDRDGDEDDDVHEMRWKRRRRRERERSREVFFDYRLAVKFLPQEAPFSSLHSFCCRRKG